ncbi:MAG: DNA mismatch repair protein MutS [Ignavibacteria bacterium]|nr:DNA mismatch repair protein MutS [Ignavibacteria bacterium]
MSTPLMKQYAKVKSRYPDTILLFRMGDFFETFEEDAKVASKVLGITLTKRRNGTAGEVPLAGFPHHALDTYLPKFLKAGHRVAVCEQMEDPKTAKGIVKRDVVEVVTPGVAFSDRILEGKQNNYLASVAFPSAIAGAEDHVGIGFVDVSTGEFGVSEFPLRQLPEQIEAIRPAEILVQRRDAATVRQILKRLESVYTVIDDWIYSRDHAYELITAHLRTHSLKGFGLEEMGTGVIAAGSIMHYLRETQKANLSHITRIIPVSSTDHIILDPSTKRNLEITTQLSGRDGGTLFSVLDRTLTPMGGRLLRRWVARPLNQLLPIVSRLDAVDELVTAKDLRDGLSTLLADAADLERLNAKVCTGRATPREVAALCGTLELIDPIRKALQGRSSPLLRSAGETLEPLPAVTTQIRTALADDPPALVANGTIRAGYHDELDELRSIAASGKQWISRHQQEERERTGIGSLKIGFNNVFGYYIEITNTHREKVPEQYIRKQTLTNAERYITPELKQYEEKVLHAEEKIQALESSLFDDLRRTIAEQAGIIQDNAALIATIDSLVALACTAVENRYTRPEVNESTALRITGGRHPVIERFLPPGDTYTPNDTEVDTGGDRILIITGPNMSGKSSYLRQTGLIVLLAQIGSFVPAESASIGIVDKIFTRVGASDNIASGESTFLVEMHEAAHIVNTATSRSLVLLDEVGRGTSTFDGISIAWALTEYLYSSIGARTLFATHYHELNELSELYKGIRNYKVDVREYGEKVVFLHKVLPGSADHSYGIQVAQMAGLPAEVTERATEILKGLESSDVNPGGRKRPGRSGAPPESGMQITMFDSRPDPVGDEIRKIDIESLTPLEAMLKLAELRQKAIASGPEQPGK